MAENLWLAGGGGLVAQFYARNLLGIVMLPNRFLTYARESPLCHVKSFLQL